MNAPEGVLLGALVCVALLALHWLGHRDAEAVFARHCTETGAVVIDGRVYRCEEWVR
jgi:hypothetical protein